MASSKLEPGSFVTKDGIYQVSHSTGHMPGGECFFLKGILLPSCTSRDCDVSYTFLRDGGFLPDGDGQPKHS
jgi:hypothetical protein